MGLHLASVLLVMLISSAASDQVVGTYNQLLDPGRITMWKTKWLAAQITLSKTNQGAKNVDVTFYINPSSTVVDGIFEVQFPAAFDLSVLANSGAAVSVSGQTVQLPVNLASEVDATVTVPFVGLPTVPGAYGPFAIRTRMIASGQIVDMNSVFGEVFITAAETQTTALDVTFVGQSSNIINRSGNTLSFKFSLTKALWAHDYIRITVAPQFALSNPVCRSVSYGGQWNVLNGTRTFDTGLLDCIVSSASGAQVLWIYGVSADVEFNAASTYPVALEISGFTNPDRDYSSSSYLWRIETIRFNTRNTLEYALCNGPETTHDWLFTAAWVPTWGRPATSVLREQTVFMDLTFTTVNRIPPGGTIVVENSADSAAWGVSSEFRCYVVTYLAPTVTCQQNVGITTITGLNAVPAGTEITLRTLSKFTTLYNAFTQEVKSITTMSAEGWLVDVGLSLARFNLPLDSKGFNAQFSVLLQNDVGDTFNKAGGTGDSKQYVKFDFQGLRYLTTDIWNYRLSPSYSTVTISCPMATQVDDFQISFPSTGLIKRFRTAGIDFSSTTTTTYSFPDSAYDAANGSPLSVASGSITKTQNGRTIYTPGTISFIAGSNHIADRITVGISVKEISGMPQVVTSGAIVLPRVVSNAASVYECALDIVDSRGSLTPVRGIAQFNIDSQSFAQRAFTYFCTAGNIAGAPVRVTFLPGVVDLYPSTAARTYYLDLVLSASDYTTYLAGVTTFHDSGANEGEAYPVDSTLTSPPTMIVTTDGSTTTFVHRVTGLGNISPQSQAVDLFFPVGVVKRTKPTLRFRTFFVLSEDPRLRYFTHDDSLLATEQYAAILTDSATTGTFDTATMTDGNNAVGGDTVSLTLSLELPLWITGDTYFYVIFPKGFAFASQRTVSSDKPTTTNVFSFVKYFPAPSLRFAFPGLLVKTLAAGTRISDVPTNVKFTGVQSPIGSASSSLTVVHADKGSILTADCYVKNTISYSTSSGQITGVYVAPVSIPGRGPEGVDISHTLTMTLQHGLDLGGSIVVSLKTDWGTNEYTSCTARGLDSAVSGGTVNCARVGNVFTITGFADFRSFRNVSVTVFFLHLTAPAITAAVSLQMFDSIKTYSSLGGLVDSSSSTGSATLPSVSVTVPTSASVPTYKKITIYPNNAGVTDSDLYLALTFRTKLPTRTVITITSPTQYKSANSCAAFTNNCFVYPLRYRSCTCATSTTTGATFSVTLDQDLKAESTLEVFFDHALNPPSTVYSPTTSAQDGFSISASWFGTVVSADTTTYRAEQLVVPGAKVTGGISAAGTMPLWMAPTTTYEAATYTFTFTVSTAVTKTDHFVIIFPDEFDAFLGDSTEWFSSEIGNYYLSCSSAQLGSLFCQVDHWVVLISISNDLTANSQVSISISGVKNPPVGTTGNFRILHQDLNGTLLELAAAFGKVTTTPLPGELDIKSLTVTSRRLMSVGDYSFTFSVTDTFLRTTELRIAFPQEFDLHLVDQKTAYSCSTSWVDHAPLARMVGPQDWNNGRLCNVNGNTVTLPPPADGINFVPSSEVRVTVKGVMTPQWGQVRSPNGDDRDFDVVDRDVWTVWSWWSSQFKLFVYQQDSMRVTSRAYSSLNAGYLGFMQPLRTISVNRYNPQDKTNRIVVYPGTQTADLPISLANQTMPLQAKSLLFRPQTNKFTPDFNKLKFTSFYHDWRMLQDEWTINFRVAADLSLAKGLYYVNWKVEESRQPGVEHPVYSIPPMTLVEVPTRKAGVIPFQISDIPTIHVGSSSVPVKVSLSNPPHTEVTLNINLLSPPATVLLSPSSLTFRPDVDFQYFNLTVTEDHDFLTYTQQTVAFTITGRDAEAYSVVPTVTVDILEKLYQTFGNVASMRVGNVTRTSFTIAPSTDQLGIVYYEVSPKGSKILSYQTMKAKYLSMTTSEAQWKSQQLSNSLQRINQETFSDPPLGTGWYEYRHQVFVKHATTFTKGGMVVMPKTDTTDPILISGLWAGTEYQIASYLDDSDPRSTGSPLLLEYVTTADTADCQPVSLLFDGFVGIEQQTRVKELLAKYVGVNPNRVQEPKYLTISPRNLQGNKTTAAATEFQFTLVASRVQNVPTTVDQTNLSPEQQTDMAADFLETLGLNLTDYNQLPSRSRTRPLWLSPAEVISISNVSVTMRFKSNANGQACCVLLSDTNPALSPDQVVEGFSFNWTAVPNQCTATQAGTTSIMKIGGVTPDEIYYAYCALTDDYPLWPTMMEYSSKMTIPFIPVHTPKLMEVEVELMSSGISLLPAVLMWLAFN